MKLSQSTLIRTALQNLGISTGLPLSSCFPTIVDMLYKPAWDKFLGIEIVKELQKQKLHKDVLNYYVAASFVSHILSFDDDPYVDSKRAANLDISLSLYDAKPYYSVIRDYLNRKSIGQYLTLVSHTWDIDYQEVDFIQAFTEPSCVGIIEYAVKGRYKLDNVIAEFVPRVFREIPLELQLIQGNGKKRNLLTSEQQTRSKADWVGLINEQDVYMEMARAKFSTLLIKYEFKVPGMLFHGGKPALYADKLLNKSHAKIAHI